MASKVDDPTIDLFDPAAQVLTTDVSISGGAPLDPFDPARLRLSPDLLEDVATEVLLTTLDVRKPKTGEFFRVNPDKAYRLELAVINVEEERATYLVMKDMHDDLNADLTPVLLVVAVNRSGTPFLWPLKLTKPGGRSSPWNDTARGAAQAAESAWVRMDSDAARGQYMVRRATGNLGEPVFPSEPFSDLLRIAFADRVIDSATHPVVRQRRGEI
ncbi:MAG TPA: hypothetical protein PLN53_01280 [Terricaulis sp.]|nr:hypothetical protein [Terricaulis sp.]